MMRGSVKPAVFLAMRTDLLNALREIDSEIDFALQNRASHRALQRARELFAERNRVADELADFGVVADPHPAVP